MLKKLLMIAGVIVLGLTIACGPRPQYKTHSGKKKLKKYNAIQYNKKDWDAQRYRGKKKKH